MASSFGLSTNERVRGRRIDDRKVPFGIDRQARERVGDIVGPEEAAGVLPPSIIVRPGPLIVGLLARDVAPREDEERRSVGRGLRGGVAAPHRDRDGRDGEILLDRRSSTRSAWTSTKAAEPCEPVGDDGAGVRRPRPRHDRRSPGGARRGGSGSRQGAEEA